MKSFINPNILKELEYEIDKNGFVSDSLLTFNKDINVYGLNIAVGWPLPEKAKQKYEDLSKELKRFDSDIYIYPYSQTHITLITLVSFKENISPSRETIDSICKLKSLIDILLFNLLMDLKLSGFREFTIDIGSPVLTSKAIILPIVNHGNEINRLRCLFADEINKKTSLCIGIPSIIHCTIGRFINIIADKNKFKCDFEKISSRHIIGKVLIDEILLTSETKPYMRKGEILSRYPITK